MPWPHPPPPLPKHDPNILKIKNIPDLWELSLDMGLRQSDIYRTELVRYLLDPNERSESP